MKERLDRILVSRGLVQSREVAKALVIAGNVFVDGIKVTKAGTLTSQDADIVLKDARLPYVSRGGLKLEAAIDFFRIDVKDKVIMDVGASTGGFTDCLLQKGAGKVYAIDVGYGQLAWSLRKDPRVIVMERTNVRYLDAMAEGEASRFSGQEFADLREHLVDIAAVDVSFISLNKVIPVIKKFLRKEGAILALVKPQFEVGRGEVGKGGIVREEEKRLQAVNDIKENSETLGFRTAGIFQSPVPGQKGNREYFIFMKGENNGG